MKVPNRGRVPAHQMPEHPTPLAEWLKRRGLSRHSFARKVGCDPKVMERWSKNQSLPTLVYAFRIEQMSDGAVAASSWLGTVYGQEQWNATGKADWKRIWAEQERSWKRQKERNAQAKR